MCEELDSCVLVQRRVVDIQTPYILAFCVKRKLSKKERSYWGGGGGEGGRSKRQSGLELGAGREEDESWVRDDLCKNCKGSKKEGKCSRGDDCISHHESNSGGQVEGSGAHARNGASKASGISLSFFFFPFFLFFFLLSAFPTSPLLPRVVRGLESRLGDSVS